MVNFLTGIDVAQIPIVICEDVTLPEYAKGFHWVNFAHRLLNVGLECIVLQEFVLWMSLLERLVWTMMTVALTLFAKLAQILANKLIFLIISKEMFLMFDDASQEWRMEIKDF